MSNTEGEVVRHIVYRCVTGAAADSTGVCVEHGETACVIGVTVTTPPPPSDQRRRIDDER